MSPTNKNKKSPFIVSKEAIIKVITESEIYPEIGKFIKQQSKIQWLLASLIFIGSLRNLIGMNGF